MKYLIVFDLKCCDKKIKTVKKIDGEVTIEFILDILNGLGISHNTNGPECMVNVLNANGYTIYDNQWQFEIIEI